MKQCKLPEHQSFAFMFACCGRGFNWYRHNQHKDTDANKEENNFFNVESGMFRKYFPNTPIFGFFGGGEYGYDYLPELKFNANGSSYCCDDKSRETTPPNKKLKKNPKKFNYQYSTIIVLISYL